jgi:predicted transcriptional regulator
MITKTQLKQSIDNLPEKFTLDELMDKIILIDKIERGNEQSERGETLSEEELDKEVTKWFK